MTRRYDGLTYKEKRILEFTKDDTLQWITTYEELCELGRLEPYHKRMESARAEYGRFDLVCSKSKLEILYRDQVLLECSPSKELWQEIEENGKRTIEILAVEFLEQLEKGPQDVLPTTVRY